MTRLMQKRTTYKKHFRRMPSAFCLSDNSTSDEIEVRLIKSRVVKAFLSLTLIFLGLIVAAAPIRAAIDLSKSAAALDLRELDRFIGTLDEETAKLLPRLDPKAWGISGPHWNLAAIGRQLVRYLLREIVFNFKLLGELLLLALALAILQNMRHAFAADTVQQMAFAVCFLVVIGIVLHSLRVTFAIARGAVNELTAFMHAIIPLLFSLITAAGGVTTTTVVHPLLVSAVGVVAGLVNTLVFPLLMFAGILGLVNYLSEGFPLKKLAQLFKKTALGLMGLIMAGFIGLIAIRGFGGSIADSTVLRTGKYFTKTFLPVVGSELADTLEMAVGCSVILKSGLGLFGLGMIILVVAFPLLKILAVGVVYNLTGALLQPLGNNRLADALEWVGEMFLALFGALAVVGLMFFITIAILVVVANYGVV
jgi:stage III sporulation protein AE